MSFHIFYTTIQSFIFVLYLTLNSSCASPPETNESFEESSKQLFIKALQTKKPDSYMAALREEARTNPAVEKTLYDLLNNPKTALMIGLTLGESEKMEAMNCLKNALHNEKKWAHDVLQKRNLDACKSILNIVAKGGKMAEIETVFFDHISQYDDLKHPIPYINFLNTVFVAEDARNMKNESKFIDDMYNFLKLNLSKKVNDYISNDVVIDESWGYVFLKKFQDENSEDRKDLYLRMSCALGNIYALKELSQKIHSPFDENVESFKHIERAGQCGSDVCNIFVGWTYYVGSSVIQKNRKKAHDLFLQSENYLKENEVDYNYIYDYMAELYENGFQGQEPCFEEAVSWYKKSAKAGSVEAKRILSLIYTGKYKNAKSNTKLADDKLAYEWLSEASIAGHTDAMLDLCHLLLKSDNFQKKIDQAFFWLEKSSALGNKKAEQYIDSLIMYAPALSRKTINKIQALMAEGDSYLPDATIKSSLEHLDLSKHQEKITNQTQNLDIAKSDQKNHKASGVQNSSSSSSQLDLRVSLGSRSDKTESSSHEDFSDLENFDSQNSDAETKMPAENDEYDLNEYVYDARRIHETFQAKKLEKLQEAIERLMNPEDKPLSSNGKKILKTIKNSPQNLDINEITKLFKDLFFKNQVCIRQTKSGLNIIIHKKDTNQHMSFSTHKKHTKDYKGFHPQFIAHLQKAIAMFEL